jgi:hypothetical protein
LASKEVVMKIRVEECFKWIPSYLVATAVFLGLLLIIVDEVAFKTFLVIFALLLIMPIAKNVRMWLP